MELPSIFQQIIEVAFEQLEDADYENMARVVIGGDMILVDSNDFEELKKHLGSEKEFTDIVEIKG